LETRRPAAARLRAPQHSGVDTARPKGCWNTVL
jgi:hypothetical protein